MNKQRQKQFANVRRHWGQAASKGHPLAQFHLAQMLLHNQGVKQNYKKAMEWYKKAAEQGHTEAQYDLGVMYTEGKGVDVNYKKAFEWFEKAAEQGYADAQCYLGVMYERGHGCLLYTSPSPRDISGSRMPSSA